MRKTEETAREDAQNAQALVSSRATDIRSDVNSEAAVNLRSRTTFENAKIAWEKQKELKSRDNDNDQRREDLCEMLGR